MAQYMEKNIPGLKRLYTYHLARIRSNAPSIAEATRELKFWSAKYYEYIVDHDSMGTNTGIYGGILEAYARREALRQYIENLKEVNHNDRI